MTDCKMAFLTLIFACSLVVMVPVAYGAEQDTVLIVLYSDTGDEIMSDYKADVENIDNMSQIDVQRVEIHATSKGKICAVVIDNDNNKHSAYYINGSGVPKHLNGKDAEMCFRNTETLHNILTSSSPDLDVWLVIVASIFFGLSLIAFGLQKSKHAILRFRLPAKLWGALLLYGAIGGLMIILAEYLQKNYEGWGYIVVFAVAMYLLIISVLVGLNLSKNPNVKWDPDK